MSAHQLFTFDKPTDVYMGHSNGRMKMIIRSGRDTVEIDINLRELNLMEDQTPVEEAVAKNEESHGDLEATDVLVTQEDAAKFRTDAAPATHQRHVETRTF